MAFVWPDNKFGTHWEYKPRLINQMVPAEKKEYDKLDEAFKAAKGELQNLKRPWQKLKAKAARSESDEQDLLTHESDAFSLDLKKKDAVTKCTILYEKVQKRKDDESHQEDVEDNEGVQEDVDKLKDVAASLEAKVNKRTQKLKTRKAEQEEALAEEKEAKARTEHAEQATARTEQAEAMPIAKAAGDAVAAPKPKARSEQCAAARTEHAEAPNPQESGKRLKAQQPKGEPVLQQLEQQRETEEKLHKTEETLANVEAATKAKCDEFEANTEARLAELRAEDGVRLLDAEATMAGDEKKFREENQALKTELQEANAKDAKADDREQEVLDLKEQLRLAKEELEREKLQTSLQADLENSEKAVVEELREELASSQRSCEKLDQRYKSQLPVFRTGEANSLYYWIYELQDEFQVVDELLQSQPPELREAVAQARRKVRGGKVPLAHHPLYIELREPVGEDLLRAELKVVDKFLQSQPPELREPVEEARAKARAEVREQMDHAKARDAPK